MDVSGSNSDVDAAGTPPATPWSKEGTVLLMRGHDRVECCVRVTRSKLIVTTADGKVEGMVDFDEDDTVMQHQIELLPDFARRSRHQDMLFPFHLKPPAVARQHIDDGTVSNGADGVLLAVVAAEQLWEWTVAIRWRGQPPEPEVPPRAVCGTTRDTNDHFDKPHVLQERLLMIGSYPPGSPAIMVRTIRFLWQCLVGACIFAAERNFEMLLSSGHIHLPDVKRYASFNTPLSMCCEGNYSPSRAYIAKTLIKRGHPVGRGEQAAGDYQFVFMLAKPDRLQASSSVLGKAIHDDDKDLIEFFIRHDDGVLHNESFKEAMVQAAAQGKTAVEFNCRSYYGMTSLALPVDTHAWAAEALRELNLADNCLTTILDSVYFALPNLEALDVSNNCLWSISPAVKQMTRLVSLKAHGNLIEALPDELEFLEELTEMTCHSNPIRYPPKSVALAGAETIKAFFAGVRQHGRVTNTDLKVLVVGLSEAGKTSLINAVVAGGSHLVRRGDRTVGIEQKRWTFEQPDPAFATAESPAGQRYVSDEPGFPFELQFGDTDTDCTAHFVAPDGEWMHNDWVMVRNGIEGMQPAPHDLTDCTWDPEARRFEGEVMWRPGKIANLFEKARFEFTLSEDFNQIEQGEIKWYFDQNTPLAETMAIGQRYSRRVPVLADVNCLFYDFAGQQEYYSSHHIFLTQRALYVLAFDLTKYSAATFQDQVLFWANAIQERVPGSKVVVVGTHADELAAGVAGAVCDKVAAALRNIRRRANRVLDRKCRVANAEVRPLNQIKQAHARAVLSAQTGMPISELEALSERKRRGLSEQDAALLQELDEITLLGGPLSAEETMDRERLAEVRAQYGDDPLTDSEKGIIEELSKLADEDNVLPPADNAKYVYLKASLDRWKMMHRQLMEVPDKVFAVSSAEGLQGMAAFVDEIKATVLNRRHFPELGEFIPTYYTQVRRAIRAKRQERGFAFMKLGDYLEMMSTELGMRVAEVEEASEFMHILGEVLYYPELDVIFLKVQFLIDAFKFVIRHDHADATVFAAAQQVTRLAIDPASKAEPVRKGGLLSRLSSFSGSFQKKTQGTDEPTDGDGDGDGGGGGLEGHADVDEAMFQAMKDSLVSVGDLHRVFLEHLWAPSPPDGLGLSSRGSDDNGMFTAMVALLEKFEIAGATARDDGGAPTRFLVPEFEPLCLPDDAWLMECPGDQIQARRCYQFDFSNGPPRGLMQRLQIKLCSRANGAASVFARDGCCMSVWGCDARLRLVKGADPAFPQIHGLDVVVRGPAAELDALWRTCNSVVELVDLTLGQWPGVSFEQHVVVDAVADGEPPAFVSLDLLRSEQNNKLSTTLIGGVDVSIVELIGSEAVGTWMDAESQDRSGGEPADCQEGTEPAQTVDDANADVGAPGSPPTPMTPITRRERRKSFSHDSDDSVAVKAEGEFTLEGLLGTELELPAATVTQYAALLRESFKQLYDDDHDDNILFYDDDGLHEAGISSRPHRGCLLGWIEACQLERRPLQVPTSTASVDVDGLD